MAISMTGRMVVVVEFRCVASRSTGGGKQERWMCSQKPSLGGMREYIDASGGRSGKPTRRGSAWAFRIKKTKTLRKSDVAVEKEA